MLKRISDLLDLAVLHLMMCGMLTLTLAIPTGWPTALYGGPMMYWMIWHGAVQLHAAEAERLSRASEPEDNA